MHVRLFVAVLAGAAVVAAPSRADDETTQALAVLKKVSREGKGNEDAGAAWKAVVGKGAAALVPTLTAMTDDNPTATNWLRTAAEAIAQNEKAAGRKLAADQLEAVVVNTKLSASGRRLAYELLVAQDPDAKAKLLPKFIDDKSPDLRREAIENQLETLEKLARPSIKADLEKLFAATRDKDQVELLAKKLGDNGGKADITAHFGFVTATAVIGPFDAPESKGFTIAYPVDKATDAKGSFKGRDGAELKWLPGTTGEKYGTFDLNKLLGKHKNAVGYALAIIVAEQETPCEIRVASPTSVKIFLNQKELFGRDEYHHGAPLDAHVGKGTLKKGENVIVLKVCQNDQKEAWAQNWQFQMRICDDTGGPLAGLTQLPPTGGKAIPLGTLTAAPEPEEKKEKK